MSTYREIVYMCLDEIKMVSDDSYFNQDHIIFLADKYRAFLLKKNIVSHRGRRCVSFGNHI